MIMRKIILTLLKRMKFLPQKQYVKIYYEYYSGTKLNYDNVISFNEKISWLKAFYHKPILTQLVDKYAVRSYVEEKAGKKYLNDLLGVYEKASQVNFDELPERFVIKGVHGFRYNLIVKDKSKLNHFKAKMLFRKWLGQNHYYRGGMEWAYKDVKPKLIAEKFLEEKGKEVLNDYKFFCFNGVPKFVQIDMDRGTNNYRCYYNLDWEKLPFNTEKNVFYEGEVNKPENFDEMIDIAKKLAGDFPFVRVDLYAVNGATIFGELTFYPADARKKFVPEKYNKIIGDYIILPEIPTGQTEII